MSTARVVFAGLFDYAGLFPPAALTMADAVAEYARWRLDEHAFLLGRFVVPASRLAELGRAAERVAPVQAERPLEPWRVSALLDDVPRDLERVTEFREARVERALVDALELRSPGNAGDLDAALARLPCDAVLSVELPLAADVDSLLAVLRERGVQAKVRTGGVTPEAVPSAADLARFLAACARTRVPFKATAGLHHALRAVRPLTYDRDAPRATLHGFLNLIAAAALAWCEAPLDDLEDVLLEQDPACFRLDDAGLDWRGRSVGPSDLAACRKSFFRSLGSCSVAEPVADLGLLGLLT